jgi:hypothetical protein
MITGLTINNEPVFNPNAIRVGAFLDVIDLLPACEITLVKDDTARYALGGKIDDSQIFQIRITVNYTDAQAAEAQIIAIRDALTQMFHASARLGGLNGVEFSGLIPGSGQYGYVLRNSIWFRGYEVHLHVRYEYSVVIVP